MAKPPDAGDATAGAALGAERRRLAEAEAGVPWRRWGPYLSERQWGTVREDYSATGEAWDFFPHDHARSRTYRWGEDGLLGMSDQHGQLCFSVALWNGVDPILKERLFGLSGPEGNHGEDVKEYYWYLDNTPTHSYMKAMYRYPQRAFPYADLVAENGRRDRSAPEYELVDTGIFAEDRFFDVTAEYAKVGPDDILIRISATNRGPDPAHLHVLPTVWYRNTWSWGYDLPRPIVRAGYGADAGTRLIHNWHEVGGDWWLTCEGDPELMFTENETNTQRLWQAPNRTPFVKDGINNAVIGGESDKVNPDFSGTKASARYEQTIAPGATAVFRLRFAKERATESFADFDRVMAQRVAEADEFYEDFGVEYLSDDARAVQRQAFAGLLWSKQFYYYDLAKWLDGDPAGPPVPESRKTARNSAWRTLNNADVLLMPDKWEYPWYAAWDHAFHCVSVAVIDPEFAKDQLILLVREWYMHPNGQLPAYEWAFDDVNPPVHAWAAWRIYKIDKERSGKGDTEFLEKIFHKLLLNFTWWVNRKDSEGNNVFEGGFLGLDNIGVFDRSHELPTGGHLEQADGTAWMGMYCLNMLGIALELAGQNPAYEHVATKFFEHFLYIAGALNNIGDRDTGLWDNEDEFFYDVLHTEDGKLTPLKVRSLVGLVPLFAVETIEPDLLDRLPDFRARLEWFLAHRPDLAGLVSHWTEPGMGQRRLLALVRGHRMKALLKRTLDPAEFLSPHGVRALSRVHLEHPYMLDLDGMSHMVKYDPAESTSGLFGGNSNWRGPIWFPLNYLIIESLRKFHYYYGDDFLVEHPTGSGQKMTIAEIAADLSRRLTGIFLKDEQGKRPVLAGRVPEGAAWGDTPLFYEYFHGDTGAGLGASHQTGWTALVAKLMEESGHIGGPLPDVHRTPA